MGAGDRMSYQDEKARRIYYQNIVYDVCNEMDKTFMGSRTVCGTVEEPSMQVQQRVSTLVCANREKYKRYAEVVRLLRRCLLALEREGWEEGEPGSVVIDAVRDFLTHDKLEKEIAREQPASDSDLRS
jgi:hypothetical protein